MLKHCLLLAHLLATLTGASYILRANLHVFSNSQHRKANGFCCNGNSTCADVDCSNQFNFCLRSLTEPAGTCSLGEYQSGFINHDHITFSEQDTVENPVIFQVDYKWPGAVELLVRVDDELTESEQSSLVLEVLVSINISHNPSDMIVSSTSKMAYTNARRTGQFIQMNFELECKEDYYGSDCGVYCAPRDDNFGHFSCDRNGNIVCLSGFNNTATNCTECILCEGCSASGGYCNSTDHCICREEYTGEHCDIDLNVCRTMEASCQNGGTCVFNQTMEDSYICICADEYDGLKCERDLNICRTMDVKCQNGGTCVFNQTLEDSFVCICPIGYGGLTCEIDICHAMEARCQNGGTCVFNQTLESRFSCSCPVGYSGVNCETDLNICRTMDVKCQNGGTCVFNQTLEDSFVCICPIGYGGLTCEIDICHAMEARCQNGGTCVFNQTLESRFSCSCPVGYSGVNCETDLNICRTMDVKCQNGGTCVFNQTLEDSFVCICPIGYGGLTCEIDICHAMEARCQNGGTCVFNQTLESRFSCSCPVGYSGVNCETDLDVCGHTSPCINNGVCTNNGPDNFTCNCTAGFEGRTCVMETDECGPNICRNGGVCKDLHLDYECECRQGFEGDNCEIELDGCIGQVCQNNGTCFNNFGDFVCYCVDGFSGRACEIYDILDPLSSLLGPIVGGALAALALLILIICLLIVLIYTLIQRSSQRKQVINSYEEADIRAAASQEVFSINNPAYRELDTSTPASKRSGKDGRFDNPIYAEPGQSVPNDGHYSHLKSRMGQSTNPQPNMLAPASSSVIDLLNSIADYSTLEDSIRTQSTNMSSANDHLYEQIQGEGFCLRRARNGSTEDDSDHDYSRLNQPIPSSMLSLTPAVSQEQDEGIELSVREESDLQNPYESLFSATNSPNSASPDSATAGPNPNDVNTEAVESEGVIVSGGATGEGVDASDQDDYDSIECGVYENVDREEVLYVNGSSSIPPVSEMDFDYDDILL